MKTCGIVVEYNPFHNGHKIHISESRKQSGCDCLIAVMSGNYVQRGEFAITDKWRRTECALAHGVDLVIELPLIVTLQSATVFGENSVHLLKLLGVDNIAFGSYNKRTPGRTPFDWLSRDEFQVDKYIADPYCGFLFTANGYRDMFTLLNYVSGKEWFASYDKELPVLLLAGGDDPVGPYGDGVKKVRDLLAANGKKNITMHIYEGGRHEILNESALFDTVCKDLIDWANSII